MPDESALLYVDGGSRGNPGPAASAYVIKSPDGTILDARADYIGRATNNSAEYNALIMGLEAACALGKDKIHIFSDSELIVRQIIGQYRVRDQGLKGLFEQVQKLLLAFDCWQIRHIPREMNRDADHMVNVKLDETQGLVTPNEPAQPIETDLNSLKILVEVAHTPAPGVCPADLRTGQCFAFSHVTPAGMCLSAMQTIMPAITDLMANDPGAGARERISVRCPKRNCGAIFHLTGLT
jgi:uncharacterized repeat protein (TIGR04076 family)